MSWASSSFFAWIFPSRYVRGKQLVRAGRYDDRRTHVVRIDPRDPEAAYQAAAASLRARAN